MADYAHEKTDEELEDLIKRIKREYRKAAREMKKKTDAFLKEYGERNEELWQQVKDEEIELEEYEKWCKQMAGQEQYYKGMVDSITEDLVNTDINAMAMVNNSMMGTYILNHNYALYQVSTLFGKKKGNPKIGMSFALMDRDTMDILLRDDPDLLPHPRVNIPKDERWNRQKVHSAVTQGILQGESNGAIAKRLMRVTEMDANAAIRSARTMTTCAENMGREASYKRAKNMGIDIMRVWMATKDERTRNSHREINGEKRPVGKAFSNGCMFPGDPSARPAEVYNCRCTLVASVDGIDYNASDEENIARISGTYDEWLKQSKRKGTQEKTGDGLLKPVEAKNEDFDYSLTTKDGNAVVIESYEKHSSVSERIYKDYTERITGRKERDVLFDLSIDYDMDGATDSIREAVYEAQIKLAKRSKKSLLTSENRITGFENMSVEERIRYMLNNTNPYKGADAKNNCYSNVVAAVAELRGYDVKAIITPRGKDKIIEDVFGLSSHRLGFMNAFEDGYKDKTKIEKKTPLERYKFIDKSMSEWGEGAIVVINVPGHTFLGIRVGGETRYFDPQVKKEYSEETMLGTWLAKPNDKRPYEILRVDNRNFTDIAYACVSGKD